MKLPMMVSMQIFHALKLVSNIEVAMTLKIRGHKTKMIQLIGGIDGGSEK